MEKFSLKLGNMVLETTRVLPVVLSIIVIVVSALGFQLIRSLPVNTIQRSAMAVTPDKKLTARIELLETKVSAINSSFEFASADQLSQIGVAKLEKELKHISEDLASLKDIIVESPEKALGIPLLRKEMDELERKQTALTASTKDQIDRIYDFSKWFLGLMITLAIGLVTMGVVRRPKSDT